ncbi:MAG: hypothetical protein GY856_20145, partial [bacterium]|nr:hypothetical protein [bacterium]
PGDWTASLTLATEDNALEIRLRDAAGNESDSVWVDILVDEEPPVLLSTTPADGALLDAPPASVVIEHLELISGLSQTTTRAIKNGAFDDVPGAWSDPAPGETQLVFTPDSALPDSLYTVYIQLVDKAGNAGGLTQFQFTVDTVAPPAPEIAPLPAATHNPTLAVSGTREPYAAMLLNGQEFLGHDHGSDWSRVLTLAPGLNQFAFTARDQAGNTSQDAVAAVLFDDIPPLPVETLTADGEGSGSEVALDWTGYDESLHGDIAHYRIFVETSPISNLINLTGLTPRATVPAGVFTTTVKDLVEGQLYYFCVSAVDASGHAETTASFTVSAAP